MHILQMTTYISIHEGSLDHHNSRVNHGRMRKDVTFLTTLHVRVLLGGLDTLQADPDGGLNFLEGSNFIHWGLGWGWRILSQVCEHRCTFFSV